MDLANTIVEMKEEILRFKAKQKTQGDSANYYVVNYLPGAFVVDRSDDDPTSDWRVHTVICHPYDETKKAIFMPIMTAEQTVQGAGMQMGKYILDAQDVIRWEQYSVRKKYWDAGGEGYQILFPKGFSIYSNVDFYIESSYTQHSF